MMNEAVHNVLKELKTHHPAYDAKVGYDIAGFVWFQGFNDQFSDEFRNNYRDNMIHFVKDVRKEYKTAKMPFVIGVLGTNMTKEGVDKNAVSVAQREAAAHRNSRATSPQWKVTRSMIWRPGKSMIVAGPSISPNGVLWAATGPIITWVAASSSSVWATPLPTP